MSGISEATMPAPAPSLLSRRFSKPNVKPSSTVAAEGLMVTPPFSVPMKIGRFSSSIGPNSRLVTSLPFAISRSSDGLRSECDLDLLSLAGDARHLGQEIDRVRAAAGDLRLDELRGGDDQLPEVVVRRRGLERPHHDVAEQLLGIVQLGRERDVQRRRAEHELPAAARPRAGWRGRSRHRSPQNRSRPRSCAAG